MGFNEEIVFDDICIFDVDDVMWKLNERVARITGIPYEKFTVFSAYDNPNFTDKEKKRVVDAYMDPMTYRYIEFDKEIIDLVNRIDRYYPKHLVHVVSNCASREIKDIKMEQLLAVLTLPKYKLHLIPIDIKNETTKKRLPGSMFIIVDDSPHNISMSNARHKIMPARPNNNILIPGSLVERPENTSQLVDMVMKHINE